MTKWVISEKWLKLDKKQFQEYIKSKKGKVKDESLKRYWRDWYRYHKIPKPKKPAKPVKPVKPTKPPKLPKQRIKHGHYVHTYVFHCQVPVWSDIFNETEHYFSYTYPTKDYSSRLALYFHGIAYPEHRVLDYYYYSSNFIVDVKVKR